ncbi:RBBP6 [Mytilus coruscus]|uniref:RBBP6 n=1 Tax=Mytilus coruscus TaxID=42192 RepID=A0A6J8BR00_MYTCO|nr:RBBP6 [Mytilus coruscus]
MYLREEDLNDRILELDSLLQSTKYSKQKLVLQKNVVSFLSDLNPQKSLNDALPSDIRKFMTTQLLAEIELLKKGINEDVVEQALREVKEYAARSREINVDTLQLKLVHLDEIHGNENLSTKQQKDEVETKNPGNESQIQQFATMMQCMQSVFNPRPSTPFMSQRFAHTSRRLSGNGQRRPPPNYTGCFKCGDISHFKIDCPTNN